MDFLSELYDKEANEVTLASLSVKSRITGFKKKKKKGEKCKPCGTLEKASNEHKRTELRKLIDETISLPLSSSRWQK